ncbi:unnamed protein product [Choristocarpus tenellus]
MVTPPTINQTHNNSHYHPTSFPPLYVPYLPYLSFCIYIHTPVFWSKSLSKSSHAQNYKFGALLDVILRQLLTTSMSSIGKTEVMVELSEEQRRRMDESRRKALSRLQERRVEVIEAGNQHRTKGGYLSSSSKRKGEEAHRISPPSAKKKSSRQGGRGEVRHLAHFGESAEAACTRERIKENTLVETRSCESCGGTGDDKGIDTLLLETFDVAVCRPCKAKHEKYQLITKKEATSVYLLPEGTIAILKFLEKDNPHHTSWTKMKLFLRKQVLEYSHKRWKGAEGLQAEVERREELKWNRAVARTKGVFKQKKGDRTNAGD